MSASPPLRSLQFVVKVSKFCNLRCGYCYEFNELGDKRRMPLGDMRRFFEAVARHADANDLESVSFVWHGGEPFMIPLDYYEAMRGLQREIFGDRIAVTNSIQTNLTILTDRHIECLSKGELFQSLGVSFDVAGDLRVDTKGALRTDAILANMQKLMDNGIPFGAIAVLARGTLPFLREIYGFYDALGIESRFLPFYMSASGDQVSTHALGYRDITDALKSLFDAWMTSPNATPVDPIAEYIDYAVAHLSDAPKGWYSKLSEFVFIVNVDGGTWGVSDAYDPAWRYGNVFRDEIGDILASPNRLRAASESSARMDAHCSTCPFFGHCPGFFVGDATPEQQRLLTDAGCPVREVIQHAVTRIQQAGLADALAGAGTQKIQNPALAVGL